jgi:hypothetical protein
MLSTRLTKAIVIVLACVMAISAIGKNSAQAWPEAAGGAGKRGVRLLEGGGKPTPRLTTKKTTKKPQEKRPVSWDVF